VRLGSDEFRLAGYEETARASWEKLCRPDPGWQAVRLELATPTGFHEPGEWDMRVPLPTSRRFFGSWLRQWNLNAPEAWRLAEGERLLDLVETRVGVSGCRGQTVRVNLTTGECRAFGERGEGGHEGGAEVFLGFAGEVEFRLLEWRRMNRDEREAAAAAGKTGRRMFEPVTDEERSSLARLARFSYFCGTGGETQRGMGVTLPFPG
jgi:CRISPR/Cas system endoribonuclease Cas6 (RAMP superfamily)